MLRKPNQRKMCPLFGKGGKFFKKPDEDGKAFSSLKKKRFKLKYVFFLYVDVLSIATIIVNYFPTEND